VAKRLKIEASEMPALLAISRVCDQAFFRMGSTKQIHSFLPLRFCNTIPVQWIGCYAKRHHRPIVKSIYSDVESSGVPMIGI
jgi:hypothetical protein